MSYQPKVYREQGGDAMIVASGGELDVQSGATIKLLDTESLAATTAEINRACDVSARIVTLTADATVTAASHEGKVVLLGEVGGNASLTVTLPAASGSGAIYRFVVSVVNTSNYVIQAADATDTMDGHVFMANDSDGTVSAFEAAADSDTITLNGSTTGGASIGDRIELIDIASNQWAVSGMLTGTGTEATPFSAAVS